MKDSRDSVLTLLRTHAAKSLDAHEAAMASDMIRFVETNPNCAERSLQIGHLTSSAWIVDRERKRTLLTHHRKLNKWLQLGGHADGELNPLAVAMREASEESGLTRLRVISAEIFDVDRHLIPARKAEPDHWHYDIRFMIEADPEEPLLISDESHDLAWIEIARMADYNAEESMLRMARKTLVSALT
ncbi:MAG: NUDIX hydrolase [Verrucomicrobia bacterium]|nr:NUDIX hydrolase [Verrucomicrobiota bacterium]